MLIPQDLVEARLSIVRTRGYNTDDVDQALDLIITSMRNGTGPLTLAPFRQTGFLREGYSIPEVDALLDRLVVQGVLAY